VSKLAVGQLEGLASEGYRITVASGSAFAPVGSILQVVSTTKTDTSSTSSSTFSDVTGLSVSITPSYSNSKILVIFTCHVATSASTTASIKLLRGSTDIFIGDAAGSRVRASQTLYDSFGSTLSGCHLDSPASTSALTYKIQFRAGDSAVATYINRSSTDSDSGLYTRTASSITVLEVAG